MERNKSKCVVCGKEFFTPPSSHKLTCSKDCLTKYLKKSRKGRKFSDETRAKISEKAKKRGFPSHIQKLGSESTKTNPLTGKFETNRNAIDWHIISPWGEEFKFHSLNNWLRLHGEEYFGCKPDSKEFHNVESGFQNAKRAVLGKSKAKRVCFTYKKWRIVPTDDDIK